MKHAIIVGHPNETSLSLSIAKAYADQVTALGGAVVWRDLYRSSFEPRLQAQEVPRAAGFQAGADVTGERDLLRDADVFAFVYPVWFNAPPAIIVGYIQRVFGMGFGYGPIHHGGNEPLLGGRRLVSFSTSGAPNAWLQQEGGWDALQNLFDRHFAAVCGLTFIGHHHFGGVTSQMRADVAESIIQSVQSIAADVCKMRS
ncbi:MAG: NAD(P)H-dependent oxidoreductase [Alphaproteobacteria bacterium]